MATVIFIKESKQTPSAMRGCINYCVQEKKTVDSDGRQYVGGVNCLGQHAYEEFMAAKNLYGKACGTYFYQYVQSFLPGEIQSYEEAHRIGLEFAGKSFPGYEVLVATHLDAQDDRGVRTVRRFTSHRTRCRNCGRSAMTSAVTTVCLFCRRRSAETVRASVRGSTVQR